jgi:hypothetical protein
MCLASEYLFNDSIHSHIVNSPRDVSKQFAVSRRHLSGLPLLTAHYFVCLAYNMMFEFTNLKKANHKFEFLNLDCLSSNFIKCKPFLDLTLPAPKIFTSKLCKTNHGFGFLVLKNFRSSFIKYG